MRTLVAVILASTLSAAGLGLSGMPAHAARYNVVCVAQGVAGCRTACSSNTHTVVCYAQVRNGRCYKYCGPPPR